MEGKKMSDRQKKLYEASLIGDVQSLNQLVQEDQLILARVTLTSFDETPLHIAAMLGHTDFVKALVHYKPDLAAELNYQGSSPLHLASTNGYTDIARVLITVNSDMCLVRDEEGRTPLHLAVIKGRVDIVKELVRARPEVVRYTADRGETLLHFAVKHSRTGCLKLLLELDADADGFVNAIDDDGNTVLHTATSLKQIETIKYLMSDTRVKVDAENGNGFTALDIIENMPRDFKVMEIRECLLNAGALSSRKLPDSARPKHQFIIGSVAAAQPLDGSSEKKEKDTWLEDNRGYLMITAAVIAIMSFYIALNPPGGVWDRDSTSNDREIFRAGTPILSIFDRGDYDGLYIRNTVTFIASLSTMILLVIGFPVKQRIFKFMIMALMFVAITSLATSYFAIVANVLSWENQSTPVFASLVIVLLVWFVVIAIVFITQVVCFIVRLVRENRNIRSERLSRYVQGKPGPDQA